jgi:ribonuclease VapC
VSNVFDASALLATLKGETGQDAVRLALHQGGGGMVSAVNWAEVLTRAADDGIAPDELKGRLVRGGIIGQGLEVKDLTEAHAIEMARLRPLTKHLGLSLGDRACLALARAEGAAVLTADRAWAQLDVGVAITVIR